MSVVIHWFRQDLRLADNPALSAAAKQGHVLPIFILDDDNAGDYQVTGASRCWLHHSLQSLDASLQGQLKIFKGKAETVINKLCQEHPVEAVYWNRCYEPWRIKRDQQIKQQLTEKGISANSFNGSLLWEPWEALKNDGTPYKVFTPFYKNARKAGPLPREPLYAPKTINFYHGKPPSLSLNKLALLPNLNWHHSMMAHWQVGEAAAMQHLKDFIKDGLHNYKEGRNFPARHHYSSLSPHLRWGEISPNQAWHIVQLAGDNQDAQHFLNEIAWREFSYSQLYHFPELTHKNWQPKFDHFPWSSNQHSFKTWCQGQTGFPIVDAGMRQLWQTGTMHNRVRMIVGSFLVKNLLLDWRLGAGWFWDCLVDADLASNYANWQWVAGCGADAAPYFRIFNPVTQGEKFDPDGHYTRQYVPELSRLPNKYLFKPWQAPSEILQQADVHLGDNYPMPMVDLKQSRDRALESYNHIKTPT